MKYLPAIACGFLLTALISYAFVLSASYSPLHSYLVSTPELNAHNSAWLLLMFHDSVIPLILAVIAVSFYRKLLPSYPFNLQAILLIQLPVTIVIIMSNGLPNKFASTYESAISITSVIASISVLMVFVVIIAYKKHLNIDKL